MAVVKGRRKHPGSWLVELFHVEVDPRLPSPFTTAGERPDGPPRVSDAHRHLRQELGCNVHPVERSSRRDPMTAP
ncbi:hypothetical protein ACIGXF_15970 [Streptomyces sp. NPDC053086]|uniref:hypothetical protein n=1 Tax=unclassified Streptomyces TaxID=2593676 RepID=UPI0037CEA828